MQSSNLTTKLRTVVENWLCRGRQTGSCQRVKVAGWMLAALGCCFLAYVSRLGEITHDVFHEMALFREALVQGEFPQHDVFAFTPTRNPAVHHEWGMGAILYFATVGSGLGLFGLSALRLSLIAILWWLMYRVARSRGAHPTVFALVSLIAFPMFWVGFSMLRAQLFTLVFLAAQMWMQECDRHGRRMWVVGWWVMFVAWLNIHAGFLVGLGMFGFHCAESFLIAWNRSGTLKGAASQTWHLLGTLAFIPLAFPLNPYGWEYLPYLLHAVSMPRPLILEWHPLWHTFAPAITLPLFALSIALVMYAAGQRRWSRLRGAPFLLVCAVETLKHIRHGSIYSTVWIAYLPAWLSHTPLGRRLIKAIDSRRAQAILGSQLIAGGCLTAASFNQFWLPTLPALPTQSSTCQPISAVEYLRDNGFQGNLLTQFNQGAFVSWELFPMVKVSLDGRYEVAYPDDVIESFHQFATGAPGWETVLDKYGSDAALINQQAEIRPKLEIFRQATEAHRQPTVKRWRFVYEDDAYVILAADGVELPYANRLQQTLADGAITIFTPAHAHRHRRKVDEQTTASR